MSFPGRTSCILVPSSLALTPVRMGWAWSPGAESSSPAFTAGSLPGQERLPAVPFKVSAVASQLGDQLKESRGAGDRKLPPELKEMPAPVDHPETHQPHCKDPRLSGEMHLPSGTEETQTPQGPLPGLACCLGPLQTVSPPTLALPFQHPLLPWPLPSALPRTLATSCSSPELNSPPASQRDRDLK